MALGSAVDGSTQETIPVDEEAAREFEEIQGDRHPYGLQFRCRGTDFVGGTQLFHWPDVQCNWKDFDELREVGIRRQDRDVSPFRDRADEKIGIGTLDASRTARVEMLGGAFEVSCVEWFVGERPEMIP